MWHNICTVYYLVHSLIVAYRYFLTTHKGTFIKTGHIQGLKASLSKFQGTDDIDIIVSNHNAIKLEINNKAIARKPLYFEQF